MRTLAQWLDEYSASHRNPTNKLLHWICVPLIAFSIAGALKVVPVGHGNVNLATIVGVLTLLYYFRLSWRLALGMTAIFLLAYWLIVALHAALGVQLLWLSVAIFVIAWIGQFIGHHVERARPSFFKDLQFLLIGPLWLLDAVYRSMSIPTGRNAVAH
ncbi:MAG TPA: Mpo1-like protein [Solimonas sp.]|nr:Mpo1-like protein [Solimonas sp.]